MSDLTGIIMTNLDIMRKVCGVDGGAQRDSQRGYSGEEQPITRVMNGSAIWLNHGIDEIN